MEKRILRQLVVRAFASGEIKQYDIHLHSKVSELALQLNAFPPDYFPPNDPNAWRHGRTQVPSLHESDRLLISEIVWDLITERILTVGMDSTNDKWPWLRLTEFGRSVLSGADSGYYDPSEYGAMLHRLVLHIDPVIVQYALEGVRSFRQNLLFGSAVMFGAAAEKAILILLDSIRQAYVDPVKKNAIAKVIDEGRMPKRFRAIEDAINLASTVGMPYSIHQGSTQHLLSFQEMVRSQRNDAVHPAAGHIDKEKVFLTMQTFPIALESMYRLVDWFASNSI